MFKNANTIKSETDKLYKGKLENLLNKYRKEVIDCIEKAKNNGEYHTWVTSYDFTDFDYKALNIIKKELRKKKYHCGFILSQEDYCSLYYKMKISWK